MRLEHDIHDTFGIVNGVLMLTGHPLLEPRMTTRSWQPEFVCVCACVGVYVPMALHLSPPHKLTP